MQWTGSEKANEQLEDISFCQKLNVDPTANHSEIVNNATESLRKQELLSNSTKSKLTVNEVRTPQILLKFHKPNTPERPVVSSVECHTIKISNFEFPNHCLHERYFRLHQQNQGNKRYK